MNEGIKDVLGLRCGESAGRFSMYMTACSQEEIDEETLLFAVSEFWQALPGLVAERGFVIASDAFFEFCDSSLHASERRYRDWMMCATAGYRDKDLQRKGVDVDYFGSRSGPIELLDAFFVRIRGISTC